MGFMMPKPKMPAPVAAPPPPPTAPDFSSAMAKRSQAFNLANAFGSTFLTAGQKLGQSGKGKSLLGN